MAKKLVSIVIVTRNRKDIVLDCLQFVFKMDYPNFEVILVDNGSEDNTITAVKEKFPQVNIVETRENLGLNGGKNLGQKQANGDYILFLDSDTVVDKNLVKELVKVAEDDSSVGVVAPKMYYFSPKNVIWYAGSFVNLLTSKTKNIGANQIDNGQFDFLYETEFAPTAYLATRQVINKLKGHDESLFMTYGDTDYGFRARKAGFKFMFCPKAKLWHKIKKYECEKTIRSLGFNLPMRAYYFARNRVIFMKKHTSKLNFLIFMFLFFPLFPLYFTFKIIVFGGGWKYLKPYWQGVIDSIVYLFTGKIQNNWR